MSHDAGRERRAPAQMSDEELIEKMLESATLAAAVTMRTDMPKHERDGRYGQLQAAIDRYRAELLRRLATIAPTEPGRVVITLDAARAALSAMSKVEQYTTEFQWKTRVNPHYRELEAAIAAAERAATGDEK